MTGNTKTVQQYSCLVHAAVFVLLASMGVHAAYAQDTAAVAGCYTAEPALDAYFFDGLVGWRLRLTRVPAGWSGVATYLTDVMVEGEPPFRRAMLLTRRGCP